LVVRFIRLTDSQCSYMGVTHEGPFKPNH